MQEQLLFENKFEEELQEDANNGAIAEPSHGSSAIDIAQPAAQVGFAKATLSRTLPAMISYIQPLNGPTGYVFGFRPKGTSGSTNSNDGVHVENTNDPDAIETQGEVDTTISVLNPITNNTAEDFMITRKLVSTNVREVKIDMTNEVEQDIMSLFGGRFAKMYYEFMNPGETNNMNKVAWFFFEYATTQMVKKTNAAFVSYLDKVATSVGTAASIDTSDKLIFALAEMQSKLYGGERNKVVGRTWTICSPDIASAISAIGEVYSGFDATADDRAPSALENTYVCTLGNMDIYSSSDVGAGGVIMGIIGNANSSSIYYTPFNEYMINSGADAYTGISNIFFRVRDDWVTNPLDTFSGTQSTPTTVDDSGYPVLTVNEDDALNNSDYVIKGSITLPTVFA